MISSNMLFLLFLNLIMTFLTAYLVASGKKKLAVRFGLLEVLIAILTYYGGSF